MHCNQTFCILTLVHVNVGVVNNNQCDYSLLKDPTRCAVFQLQTPDNKTLCYGSKQSIHKKNKNSSKNTKKLRLVNLDNISQEKKDKISHHFNRLCKSFTCQSSFSYSNLSNSICVPCYTRALKSEQEWSECHNTPCDVDILPDEDAPSASIACTESASSKESQPERAQELKRLKVRVYDVSRSREKWQRKFVEGQQAFAKVVEEYDNTIEYLNKTVESQDNCIEKLKREKGDLEKVLAESECKYSNIFIQHELAVSELHYILETDCMEKECTDASPPTIAFIKTKTGKRYSALAIEKTQYIINKYNLSGNCIRELFYEMLSEFSNLTLDEVMSIIPLPGHSQQAIHSQIVAEARKQSISNKVSTSNSFAMEVDEGTVAREKYFDINVLFQDFVAGGTCRQFLGMPKVPTSSGAHEWQAIADTIDLFGWEKAMLLYITSDSASSCVSMAALARIDKLKQVGNGVASGEYHYPSFLPDDVKYSFVVPSDDDTLLIPLDL